MIAAGRLRPRKKTTSGAVKRKQNTSTVELVAPASTGRVIRRITWTDPDSDGSSHYLANEMKLSMGLIVLL